MKIFTVMESNLEVFVHYFGKNYFWVFTMTQFNTYNLQYYKLGKINLTGVNYLAMSLFIFLDESDNKKPKTYYVQRMPGAKFPLDATVLLTESKFIKGYSSSEENEIIIETLKWHLPFPGLIISAVYSVFNYNLRERKFYQTQAFTVLLNSPLNEYGRFYSFDTFNLVDQTFLNFNVIHYFGNFFINPITNKTDVKWTSSDRRSYWVVMDAYTGFGAVTYFDPSYNLYNVGLVKDLSINQYIMLPFGVKLVENKTNFVCNIIKQRLRNGLIEVKFIPAPTDGDNYKYLNLSFIDTRTNSSTFVYNIEFITTEYLREHTFDIWEASNLTSFEVVVKQKKGSIELGKVARGGFINKQLSRVGREAVDYIWESTEKLEFIEANSLVEMKGFFVQDVASLHIDTIEMLYGLEHSIDERTSKYLLFLKKSNDPRTHIYERSGSDLTLLGYNPIQKMAKKILPIQMNIFFFLMTDGSFEIYNSESRQPSNIPYPGVNCVDIARNFHINFKPSLFCLNVNDQVAIYYIDELLAKSLSNSLLKVYSPPTITFSRNSRILTSENYPGMLFTFLPSEGDRKSAFHAYFLESDERPEFRHVCCNYSLNYSSELIGAARPVDLVIQKMKIIVLFKKSSVEFVFAVFQMEEDYHLRLMKVAEVPKEITVDSKSRLMEFKKEFVSLSYHNEDPLLALEIKTNNNHNVMIIDAFSTTTDTFPCTILPRSSSRSIYVFPTFGFTITKYKTASVGILHYKTMEVGEQINLDKYYYRFQLVQPSAPRVSFDVATDTLQSHKDIFAELSMNKGNQETIKLESFFLAETAPNSRVEKRVNISQIKANELNKELKNVDNSQTPSSYSINPEHFVSKFDSSRRVVVFSREFSEVFDKTAIDWKFILESKYDSIAQVFKFSYPLWVQNVTKLMNFKGLKKFERFCYRFKKTDGSNRVCASYGLAFYFPEVIGISYSESMYAASLDRVILSPFNSEQCIDNFVVSNQLMTFCLTDFQKKMIYTDMIDLKVERKQLEDQSTITPSVTLPKVFELRGVYFLKFTQKIKDQSHRKSIGISNYFIYSSTNSSLANFTDKKDWVMQLIFATNGLFTDNDVTVHYITKRGIYLMSSLTVSAGNLIAFQLLMDMRHAYNESNITQQYDDGNYTGVWSHHMTFVLRGSLEMRNLALTDIYIKTIVFDKAELIVEGELDEDVIYNYLVYLPNYHSYFMRYFGFFQRCRIIIHKLFNPFAGLDNEYKHEKPNCHLWACITVHKFGSSFYLILYDMKFEKIRAMKRESNFVDTLKLDKSIQCDITYKLQIDLDNLEEKYFIYPIQIFNMTDIETIRFNQTYFQNQTLQLFVFHSSTSSVTTIHVHRNLTIQMENIYISSKFIHLKVSSVYGIEKQVTFSISDFKEASYAKYWIAILLIIAVACVYSISSRHMINQIYHRAETAVI
jgi:hypothetical protein